MAGRGHAAEAADAFAERVRDGRLKRQPMRPPGGQHGDEGLPDGLRGLLGSETGRIMRLVIEGCNADGRRRGES